MRKLPRVLATRTPPPPHLRGHVALGVAGAPGSTSARRLRRGQGMQDVHVRLTKAKKVTAPVTVPEAPHSYPAPVDSDVFVTREAPSNDVTLVVYEWHNVQPGVLSWVFPSLASALGAVRAMKNAVRWLVVRGRRSEPPQNLEEERTSGAVLCEA